MSKVSVVFLGEQQTFSSWRITRTDSSLSLLELLDAFIAMPNVVLFPSTALHGHTILSALFSHSFTSIFRQLTLHHVLQNFLRHHHQQKITQRSIIFLATHFLSSQFHPHPLHFSALTKRKYPCSLTSSSSSSKPAPSSSKPLPNKFLFPLGLSFCIYY